MNYKKAWNELKEIINVGYSISLNFRKKKKRKIYIKVLQSIMRDMQRIENI
jgi:hypothetical protein